MSIVWCVNTLAGLPAHAFSESLNVGEQMGFRTPALKAVPTSCGSGLWLAAADREAVLTSRGSSDADAVHKMEGEDGEVRGAPRVTRNCDTLLRSFD